MKNEKLKAGYLYILLVLVLCGCQRRALEDELGDLALVPIHIDWSQSALDVSQVHNVSVWFFPHNGAASFEYRYDGNLTDMEARLPEGAYSIIVFNEAIDYDWKSLQFEGTDKYNTFRASARPDTFRGLSTKSDETDVRKSPDALAVWSTDKFEVSTDMVHATTMGSRAENSSRSQQINVFMKPLTKSVKITAYVQNLANARLCSGTLTGAVGAVLLATGEAYMGDVSHMFIMNNRIYDTKNPANGYIHANLLVFSAAIDTQNVLDMDFELTDGKSAPPESFDVTDRVSQDEQEIDINVGTNIEEDPEDHPIILPEVDVKGDVAVDDWNNEFIPII